MMEALAFGMIVKLGVGMLCAKQQMIRRQKDRRRIVGVVRVLRPVVFGEECVAPVYSIATRGESLSRT